MILSASSRLPKATPENGLIAFAADRPFASIVVSYAATPGSWGEARFAVASPAIQCGRSPPGKAAPGRSVHSGTERAGLLAPISLMALAISGQSTKPQSGTVICACSICVAWAIRSVAVEEYGIIVTVNPLALADFSIAWLIGTAPGRFW